MSKAYAKMRERYFLDYFDKVILAVRACWKRPATPPGTDTGTAHDILKLFHATYDEQFHRRSRHGHTFSAKVTLDWGLLTSFEWLIGREKPIKDTPRGWRCSPKRHHATRVTTRELTYGWLFRLFSAIITLIFQLLCSFSRLDTA